MEFASTLALLALFAWLLFRGSFTRSRSRFLCLLALLLQVELARHHAQWLLILVVIEATALAFGAFCLHVRRTDRQFMKDHLERLASRDRCPGELTRQESDRSEGADK